MGSYEVKGRVGCLGPWRGGQSREEFFQRGESIYGAGGGGRLPGKLTARVMDSRRGGRVWGYRLA